MSDFVLMFEWLDYVLGWMKHTYNRLIPIQNRKASPIMLLRCPAKFQTILINLVWGRTPPLGGWGEGVFKPFLKLLLMHLFLYV